MTCSRTSNSPRKPLPGSHRSESLTHYGADPVVDRDSSINKRVDTGGTKFADLFRDFYTSFRRMSLMDREYNVKRGEGTHVSS
jgi:hypothetical protein